jgi:hypothetical protein
MTTASTQHSFVGFAIGRLGVSKVRGRFNRFDAEIVDTTDADRGKACCRRPFRCRRTSPMTLRSTRVTGAGSEYTRRADDPRGHPSDR